MKYVDGVLKGLIKEDNIQLYIDEYYRGKMEGELYECLGFTFEQYMDFIFKNKSIQEILDTDYD